MLQKQKKKSELARSAVHAGSPGLKFFSRIRKGGVSPDAVPAFGVISGACGLPKSVGISGDSHICRKLTKTTYITAIADGMGTGRRAAECSRFVLENLYQLLRVGITPLDALKSVNSAVPLSISSECFSTVDLAVFDLSAGACNIYKAGGAPTIIQRGGEAGILKMPALPIGIIEEPDIKYTTFSIERGDRYFFLSDGVTESPEPDRHLEWAVSLILEHPGEPPRSVSERLLRSAVLRYGQAERDDMTVVAVEIV